MAKLEGSPCDDDRDCRYRDGIGCANNIHHQFYPRRDYRDSVGRAFRNLVINKTVVCMELHTQFHAENQPPKKPSRSEMLEVLDVNQ